jgi:IPT/TIG domain
MSSLVLGHQVLGRTHRRRAARLRESRRSRFEIELLEDRITPAPLPTVTGLSPSFGPASGGTFVTVSGTDFEDATAVFFGTNEGTDASRVSPTTITVHSPAGSGTVDVTVVNPAGTSPTNPNDVFTYLAVPVVSGVVPNNGPLAGGTLVTITGTSFTGASSVAFGTTQAASFSVVSATQVMAVSPPGISAGPVDVTVTSPGGTSAKTSNDVFTYLSTPVPGPTVTGLSPTSGPAAGGTFVTIAGTNFVNVSAVDFGTTPGIGASELNNNTLTVYSPAGSGVVDVTVMTNTGMSPINRPADQFTYSTAPVVLGISPTSGPLIGGTLVTITGSGFTGATVVDFGTVAGTGLMVNSDSSITVDSPPSTSPGPVDVTVTTPGGTSAKTPADVFTYVAAPTVTGLSPNFGPLAGGTMVTITGTSFTGASSVAFGTTPAASFSVVSSTTITAVSPPGTGIVDVIVTAPSGTSTLSPADQFTYVAAPTVTAISPRSGPSNGGTLVTITGTGFSQPDVPSVYFGLNPATDVTVVSPTMITAVSPPGTGSVDVTVITAGGTSPTNPADVFTYTSTIDGPRVTGAVRYGYHAQPTYFVIYFNMPLDRASAQLASNYSVVAWKIVGLIGQTSPVKSATYNAKTDTVTLAFPRRLLLRKSYTLTINGTTSSGVKNINGALLDGANTGQPGSNYVTRISQYNLAGSAGQRPVAAALRAKVKSLIADVKVAFHHRDV